MIESFLLRGKIVAVHAALAGKENRIRLSAPDSTNLGRAELQGRQIDFYTPTIKFIRLPEAVIFSVVIPIWKVAAMYFAYWLLRTFGFKSHGVEPMDFLFGIGIYAFFVIGFRLTWSKLNSVLGEQQLDGDDE